jgi:hypothetical protein
MNSCRDVSDRRVILQDGPSVVARAISADFQSFVLRSITKALYLPSHGAGHPIPRIERAAILENVYVSVRPDYLFLNGVRATSDHPVSPSGKRKH